MTELSTTVRVFLKYNHPTGKYGGTTGCDVLSWYALADEEDHSKLKEALDANCDQCGAAGKLDRQVYILEEDGPRGCAVLPPKLNPDLIKEGYPGLLTNSKGYDNP